MGIATQSSGGPLVSASMTATYPVRTVAATGDITVNDGIIYYAGASDITLTLPLASSCIGTVFHVVRAGTGNVTLARAGSDTINGANSLSIVAYADPSPESTRPGVSISVAAVAPGVYRTVAASFA